MYWLTADTHFGHGMMVEQGYRPIDFEDQLEKNLLRCLKPNDTLIHLGDVFLHSGGRARWIQLSEKLACQKILVRGNHDGMSGQSAKTNGFDVILDGVLLTAFRKTIMFTHEPLTHTDAWDWNIHGHLHAGEHRGEIPFANDRRILISMEHLKYRPIPLESVLSIGSTPAFSKGRFQALEI